MLTERGEIVDDKIEIRRDQLSKSSPGPSSGLRLPIF